MITNKPNLFIVGAAKSGTTSLYNYLAQHPDIYTPPIKEPHHFGTDIDPRYFRKDYLNKNHIIDESYFSSKKLEKRHIAYIKELSNYLELFRDANEEKYLLDVSNSYLYSHYAAKEIYEFNKDSKIIIILRHPVDRAISHYMMDVAQGRQTELDAYLAIKQDYESTNKGWGISNLYIELSQYKNQIERYFNTFPDAQILLLSFDELKNNPNSLLNKIWNFLDLRSISVDTSKMYNPSGIPKNKFLDNTIKIYKKYFSFLRISTPTIKKLMLKKPEINNLNKTEMYLQEVLEEEIGWYKIIND